MIGANIPCEAEERHVKENLGDIVLSMLKQQPMCGYDVIKVIFQKHRVLVSQGRVYPLLFSLEGKGIIKGEIKKDTRIRVYSVAEQGERVIENKLRIP